MSKEKYQIVVCADCIHFVGIEDYPHLSQCKRAKLPEESRKEEYNLIAPETSNERDKRVKVKLKYCVDERKNSEFPWDLNEILFGCKRCGPNGNHFKLNKEKLVERL